jgi:GNAT superfamily N-acetyltransferase
LHCRHRGERAQFIAIARRDGVDVMIGSARYVVEPDGRTCEMAIVVNDAWQGHGVGRRLLGALIEQAKRDHLQTMVGKVLGSNAGMAEFARRQGFRSRRSLSAWPEVDRPVARSVDSARSSGGAPGSLRSDWRRCADAPIWRIRRRLQSTIIVTHAK